MGLNPPDFFSTSLIYNIHPNFRYIQNFFKYDKLLSFTAAFKDKIIMLCRSKLIHAADMETYNYPFLLTKKHSVDYKGRRRKNTLLPPWTESPFNHVKKEQILSTDFSKLITE